MHFIGKYSSPTQFSKNVNLVLCGNHILNQVIRNKIDHSIHEFINILNVQKKKGLL